KDLLKEGDVVGVREASANGPLFAEATERMKTLTAPSWLEVNPESRTASVKGGAVYTPGEQVFDLGVVVEFYNR
ncbi:30S ribosomal protein S4, partial [Candidatus Parcubacteria bacterium]|nr:30S ribosomal protein S4 [Candidatus Parcubacteria bacterium]